MSIESEFIAALNEASSASQGLNENLASLINTIASEQVVLGVAGQIETGLSDVKDLLEIVKDALSVITVIPEVGEIAAPFADMAVVLLAEVSYAESIAEAMSGAIEPFVMAMKSEATFVQSAIKDIGPQPQAMADFLQEFNAAVAGNTVPAQTIAEFCQRCTPMLSTFSGTMRSAGNLAAGSNAQLGGFDLLTRFRDALNEFEKVFGPAQAMMTALQNELMSIKITVDGETITLYQVFQEFAGVEKYIDAALQPINELLGKVKLVIVAGIPPIRFIHEFESIVIPQNVGFSSLNNELENGKQMFRILTDYFQMFLQNEQQAESHGL